MGTPLTTTATLLLGAEGCSELGMETPEQPSWIRAATTEELERVFTSKELLALAIDHNMRPYYPVTVTDDAPQDVWATAVSMKRVVRLIT
jgi:hypothetical protein